MITIGNSQGTIRAVLNPIGAGLESMFFLEERVIGNPGPYPGVVLFPWPNRIRDGKWSFAGQEFQLAINETATNSGLHGLVSEEPFNTLSESADSCTFIFELDEAHGYPFDTALSVSYTIVENALKVSAKVTNKGVTEAPIAIGFHPWFRVSESSVLRTNQSYGMVNDQTLIPLAEAPLSEFGFTSKGDISLEKLEIDNTIFGAGKPEIVLETEKYEATIGQFNLPFTHLYTNRWSESETVWLAIEPQSALANSLQSGDSIILLKPRESFEAGYSISLKS